MPEPRQPLKTPVALVIFRRPDLTAKVFAAIRHARPQVLLVIADGPRDAAEKKLCDEARAQIVVDWPCELITNYSDVNLGTKRRVSSGIDWVFEQFPEAIILEDDTLPSDSFFAYCQEMLARYRDDERVMCVCGMNLYPERAVSGDETCFFGRYGHTNGWASWRRAWRHFDVDMKAWPEFRRAGRMRDLFASRAEQLYWTQLFELVYRGEIDTCWDYQWWFARFTQAGLSITPAVNMVANLGFRADGTNTLWDMPRGYEQARRHHELWRWIAPRHVVPNRAADDFYFTEVYNPDGWVHIANLAFMNARKTAERLFERQVR